MPDGAFAHSPEELKALMMESSMEYFTKKFGSVANLMKSLKTSGLHGLSSEEVPKHMEFYGRNKVEPKPPKSFCKLFFGTFKDITIIILLISAIVSIVVGSIPVLNDEEYGWIDGVAILVAVMIVAFVSSTNEYSKEKQFRKLNAVKNNKQIKVVRNGKDTVVSIFDIVVGDIAVLELGDQIPADGVLIACNDMKCDESGMTGESDEIKKDLEENPFVIGSCLITHGSGRMVVLAVGKHSKHGDILATLQEEDEGTPLQEKLEHLAKQIGYAGISAAVLTFLVLVIRFFVSGRQSNPKNFTQWVGYLITAITIIVLAVPEGLPLAVTISLAFSMKKMMQDQCLVRKLHSCETMGSIDNITSDKTGTLTLNQMTVVRMRIAERLFLKGSGKTDPEDANCDPMPNTKAVEDNKFSKAVAGIFALTSSLNSTATLHVDTKGKSARRIHGKRGKGTSESADTYSEDKAKVEVVGNKTEGALLILSRDLGYDYADYREMLIHNGEAKGAIAHAFEFTSDRKRMSVVVDLEKFGTIASAENLNGVLDLISDRHSYLVLSKGASEIMLERCRDILQADGTIIPLTESMRAEYEKTIVSYATKSLRTLCLAYKSISKAAGNKIEEATMDDGTVEKVANYANADYVERDLTLICLVGIMDPLRPGVANAVSRCQKAGITVRMVTGDNKITAIAIAKECGILPRDISPDVIDKYVITGPEFRKLSDADLDAILDTLQVIARAAPKDKYRLVKRLKYYNHTVAATGDGSNDAPQLKAADVGLAMGITGTEVAKEASDIIIMDDNFLSIVRAVEWGRSVLANVRKFLQFQLTVNIAAVVVAFLGAAVLEESPLTALQMLYVNLLMDSLGALALATESPAKNVLDYEPVHRAASLVAPGMVRNILLLAIYQILVILLMLFGQVGDAVLMVPKSVLQMQGEDGGFIYNAHGARVYRYTCIYNFFIFAQIFNEFNSRRINNELNVFSGLHKAPMFVLIILGSIAMQLVIMMAPGVRFVFHIFDCTDGASSYCGKSTNRGITWKSWVITLAFAFATIFVHLFGRLKKLPPEFKVSEKAARKAMEKKHARAQKKGKGKKGGKKDAKEGGEVFNLLNSQSVD